MIEFSAEAHREFLHNPFRRTYRIALFFILFAMCCFTRLWDLDYKSLMHDETLFIEYTYRGLYKDWNYYYQPILHGPTMLHLQNIVFHIFGTSDYTMRLGNALLGVFGFFWIWKMRYWLGEVGTWTALILYDVSPGVTFYQRFFHMDSLFLFTTLWIVASFANWWRTRDGRWLASGIAACAVLFANKESSLFVYFSVFTFFLLAFIHDLVAWFFEGKRESLRNHLLPAPRFPNPAWPTLLLGGFIVLCLTQIFEGIKYDADVMKAIGHGWVLEHVRSIPLALGWVTLTPAQAPHAGGFISGDFWVLVYAALVIGLLVSFGIFKLASDRRIGNSEFATDFWRLLHGSRWYALGGLGLSMVIYITMFTTIFKHSIGFFDIYARTWSYWGGQHEWGRIFGPFHQHLLNILTYELPATILVVGAWIYGLFTIKSSRSLGFAMLLVVIPFAAFHKLIFSHLEATTPGLWDIHPLNINFLKPMMVVGIALGFLIMLFPKSAKVLLPVSFVALIVSFEVIINSKWWNDAGALMIFRDSEPVMLMGRHMNLRDFMEVKFNFDAGWNLMLVLALVFLATVHTWNSITRGERFHAFLIWWTVTSFGAASYAREAVPQVGIHAMMPLTLLAASYAQKLFLKWPRMRRTPLVYIVFGLMLLWNMKATFNLNFYRGDDIREKIAYGPNHRDVKHHLHFIREYAKIAGLRMGENNVPTFISDYNKPEKFKNVRIYMRSIDGITWPAKWYLRDVEYTEGSNPEQAIKEGWDFLILKLDDEAKYPDLKTKYNIHRGRATVFWMPNPIAKESFFNIWKEWIPGHYLDGTPQAMEAFNSKQDWYRLWRFLLMRETFEGTNRTVPSVSSIEDYLFCFRKDLY